MDQNIKGLRGSESRHTHLSQIHLPNAAVIETLSIMPSLSQLIKDYCWATAGYVWTLVPGMFITGLDFFNWFRKHEWKIPRWAKVTVLMLGLFTGQFLAYREATLKLYEEQLSKNVIASQLEKTSGEIDHQRHSLSTGEPVFSNIVHLLDAFRMYRISIGQNAKCTVYVTAPNSSADIAFLVAQVSIATSNCSTVSTTGGDLSPSRLAEITDGTSSGLVVVNAPEGDKGADHLISELTSLFRVKRGYKTIPAGHLAPNYPSPQIWIQFGDDVIFNSQSNETHRK